MVAAITGAGSGIGRALALELASRGVSLALADIDEDALAETALLARPFGGRVKTYRVDVSREADVTAFAAATAAEYGRVNLLINNAGVALGGTFAELSQADLEWIMGINFWGVVYGCRHFLPLLQRVAPAQIVNLSSVFGLVAPPGQTGYAASKFAVRGFSEALRHELSGSGVRLCVVHPGGINTAIARRARSGSLAKLSADEIARELATFERRLTTSPHLAAERLLRGVERGQQRILIGNDARVLDLAQRLLPERYWALLGRLT
ncbi:SDR family NAD(P)-dependent oxidoreductase [Deinococcus sp.]|uniref:SDR family NAD(P)-dependent oxidoreductase n=1 Tax=Deinococcus sp. TaxID=47478 RepID=UPI003B5CB589